MKDLKMPNHGIGLVSGLLGMGMSATAAQTGSIGLTIAGTAATVVATTNLVLTMRDRAKKGKKPLA